MRTFAGFYACLGYEPAPGMRSVCPQQQKSPPVEVLTTLEDQGSNQVRVRLEGGETLGVTPLPIDTIVEAAAGNFVFRPGGVAGNGVFTTWATLAAAVALLDPALQKFVSVDDSIAAAHVTTGTWPGFENTTFQSGGVDAANAVATLIFDTGARLTGVEHIEFNAIQVSLTDAGGTVIPSTTANLVITLVGSGIQNAGGAAGLATVGAGFQVGVRSFQSSMGVSIFKGAATASYLLLLFSGSSLSTNTVNGTAGGTVVIQADGSSQVGIAGTTQTPAETTKVVLDPQPTFVFRAGGTAGGNVFITWASLFAAASLATGSVTVAIDNTLAACHVTTGGPYNVNGWTFTSVMPGAANADRKLIVDDGATFSPGATVFFENIIIEYAGTTGPAWSIGATQSLLLFLYDSILQATGTKPLVDVTTNPSPGLVRVFQIFNANIVNAGTPVLQADATATMLLRVYDGCSVAASTLAGAGTITINSTKMATVSATQAGVTGTLTITPFVAPNTTQATGNTGSGTTTSSVQTGNISKLGSGKMAVQGVITGTISAGGTITVSLLRDATPIGNALPALTILADTSFVIPFQFIDTAPDFAAHTYTLQGLADGAHTITTGANGNQVQVVEL